MSEHSNTGPSGAERWMNCAGSVAAEAASPPQKPSVYAAQGSVAHGVAELLLKGEVDELGLMVKLGETVTKDGFPILIDEDMTDGARFYRDTVQDDYVNLIKDDRPTPVQRLTEVKVAAESIDKDMWGRADHIMFQKGNKLYVYDFKYGQGKMVSAVENPQACIYALAAIETVAGPAFDEVEIVIVQPRAVGERVKRWTTTVKWLVEVFKPKVVAARKRFREPNAPRTAGEWCRWCRAQASCEALRGAVQEQTKADFSVVPMEGKTLLPPVDMMTPEKLALALDWEDTIEAWYGAIRQRVNDMLVNGQDVPGYKLVDGRSNRKWADDTGERAAAYFAPKYGHRVYAPKEALSVAQMEKLVGKGKIPEEFIIKPEAPKKVAKSDDPRPVASTTAQQDFDPTRALPEKLEPVEDLFGTPVVAKADIKTEGQIDPTAGASTDPVDDLLAEAQGKKKEPLWPQ
jgi:hypothetical protein